jgi:transposase
MNSIAVRLRHGSLVANHAPAEWADLPAEEIASRVIVGIETDRGPWVAALSAAGYRVFAINPLSAARYRQRHSTSDHKIRREHLPGNTKSALPLDTKQHWDV